MKLKNLLFAGLMLGCAKSPTKLETVVQEMETNFNIEHTLNIGTRTFPTFAKVYTSGVVINNENFSLKVKPILTLYYNSAMTDKAGEYEGIIYEYIGVETPLEYLKPNQAAFHLIWTDKLDKEDIPNYYTFKWRIGK